MLKPCMRLIVTVAAWLAVALPAGADSHLGRVFLLDGTTLTCLGEYARLDDRIVFSLPLGQEPDGRPRLQLMTLPSSRIDWARTERYRDTVRAAQYADTRGESDFTLMTGEVARTLNDIAFTADPARKLVLAEDARKRLTDWPAEHYGYRAGEVHDIAALLDEAVSELRASAGGQAFDLNLVAMAVPDTVPLMPEPTPGDIIAQALAAADLADVPAERIGMLTSVVAYIDSVGASLSDTSRLAARTFAERRLDEERRADRDYSAFADRVTRKAASLARRANVRGIERIIGGVDARDQALGRRRPDQVRAVLTALSDQLDAARRLRLARDQWNLRLSAYRSYTRLIRSSLTSLDLMQAGLEDIKRLAGPDAPALARLATLADRAARELHFVVPPSDLASVHSLLQSACDMGASAARIRREAVGSGSMTVAWNASAAAAGSLMLVAQARDDLGRYLAPPALR